MVSLHPGTEVERYRVERIVASGAYGMVLRARHVHLGSLHALKVLHAATPLARERLLREGRIQARLRHPGIVAVTDVLPLDDGVALVMELVDGPDLYRWSRAHTPTLAEADALVDQLCAAVAHAHAAGVLHRDLKPDNVLVEVRDGGLAVRVADFGLAVAEDDARLTRSGQAMGTPRYMAPEQYRDAAGADARADVYALGAIAYELVTGHPLTQALSVVESYELASIGRFTPIAELNPDVPGRMIEAISAALRPDPAERPATVDELRRVWRGGSAVPVEPWSEAGLAAVGEARPQPEPEKGGAAGRVEGTLGAVHATQVPATAPPPSPRRGPLALAAFGAVAAVIGLTAVGIGLASAWRSPSGAAVPTPSASAVAPAPEPDAAPGPDAAAPVPAPDAAPVPEPTSPPPTASPAEPTAHTPKPVASPTSADSAAPSSRTPTSTPKTPSRTASVRVTGVSRARLLDDAGRSTALPASVAPGTYTVEAWFVPERPTRVLTVHLDAGDARTVTCHPELSVCE